MTAPGKEDSVRLTTDTPALFGDRIVPAGTPGVVLDVYPDGTCYVDFTIRPQTADEDGDFVQAEVPPGRLEITGAR
jgi:hypothetical protein